MKFNANKLKHLWYGKEQEIKSTTTYKSYDGSNIDNKEEVKDLGIMMSNTATFTFHIRNIVKKTQRQDGMGVETLLKSLVIPLLEYCCQLWNPWKAKDIQAIKAI